MSVFKKIIGSLEIGKKQKMSGVFMIVAILSVVSLLISNVVAKNTKGRFKNTKGRFYCVTERQSCGLSEPRMAEAA